MTPALRQNLTLAVLVLTGINMRPLLTSIVLWSNLNGHFDRVFSPRQGT